MLRDDHPPGALGVASITTEDPHRLLGEPAEKLTAVGDLSLGLGQWFAHFEGHQQADIVLVLLNQVESPPQDLGAFPRWRLSPGRRSVDSCVQRGGAIFDACVGDGLDHFAGRRIMHDQRATGDGWTPFTPDEQPIRYRLQQRFFRRF